MQAYAEGYELMAATPLVENVTETFDSWREGTVIRSWLLDLAVLALKADPDLADIPVVMVTFVTERALAASLGAADYVVKPVDWDRLRHVMERFREAEGDILVVDDDEDTRHRSRVALEKNGWTVTEAANGRDALDQVERAIPRMILLDLTMPVMDGFAFLKELRDKPGCAGIPVVVLTALDLTAEDRRRLLGVNQILNKGDTSLGELAKKLASFGSSIKEITLS